MRHIFEIFLCGIQVPILGMKQKLSILPFCYLGLKSMLTLDLFSLKVLTELPAKRRQRISFEIGQDSERKKVFSCLWYFVNLSVVTRELCQITRKTSRTFLVTYGYF